MRASVTLEASLRRIIQMPTTATTSSESSTTDSITGRGAWQGYQTLFQYFSAILEKNQLSRSFYSTLKAATPAVEKEAAVVGGR